MDEFVNSTELSTPEELTPNEQINKKLRACFDGRIVRKDLTKSIKEGANVPVYVLEFLLGQYCSSDDQTVIDEGVANVKKILSENYVRPDEAQKILSLLRQMNIPPLDTSPVRCLEIIAITIDYHVSDASDSLLRCQARFVAHMRQVFDSLTVSQYWIGKQING